MLIVTDDLEIVSIDEDEIVTACVKRPYLPDIPGINEDWGLTTRSRITRRGTGFKFHDPYIRRKGSLWFVHLRQITCGDSREDFHSGDRIARLYWTHDKPVNLREIESLIERGELGLPEGYEVTSDGIVRVPFNLGTNFVDMRDFEVAQTEHVRIPVTYYAVICGPIREYTPSLYHLPYSILIDPGYTGPLYGEWICGPTPLDVNLPNMPYEFKIHFRIYRK